MQDRHFWARGYNVDTVGQNKKQMEEYIRHQVEEDRVADQMSLKEFIDPLAGNKNPKALRIAPSKAAMSQQCSWLTHSRLLDVICTMPF